MTEDLPPAIADALGSVRAEGVEPDPHVVELSVAYVDGHLTAAEFVMLVKRQIQKRRRGY